MKSRAGGSTSRAGASSPEFRRITALGRRELETILVRGETPSPAGLAGWEFRGANTPEWARLLGIKKFLKGFYQEAGGELYGYNLPARQNRMDEEWVPRGRRFGFYRVVHVDAAARDNAYLHALLLDYRLGRNFPGNPVARLRDYLVRVHPGSDDLLLGKAYVALGPARVPVSYFVLERHRKAP